MEEYVVGGCAGHGTDWGVGGGVDEGGGWVCGFEEGV